MKLKGIKSFIWEKKKSVHTVERSPLKGPRGGRATFELPNATGGSGKGDQKPQKLSEKHKSTPAQMKVSTDQTQRWGRS